MAAWPLLTALGNGLRGLGCLWSVRLVHSGYGIQVVRDGWSAWFPSCDLQDTDLGREIASRVRVMLAEREVAPR